ncbi:UPF0061 protein YdiU [Seminavis robusta]|uniref:Selenoprotein O n=1 Tax=Seminavis robusta TaxID=568900 RepID=A0A9N8HSI1_9STRA|nr:UPF0061 protein YdiU [Seminavis robusta]|eukprot:Sro1388_g268450.1 UPF0061 protein YdiU (653) ;mRNA; r:16741-18699
MSNSSSNKYDGGPLDSLNDALINTWVRQLKAELPENVERSRQLSNLPTTDDTTSSSNRHKRRVLNGHYVLVEPTGLPQPKLVIVSKDVAQNLLGLTPAQIESEDFVQFVSGNVTLQESWATPYALSIMGERYTNNCPFGDGTGYGDGRAISIGEVSSNNTANNTSVQGYELQLKGAGKTPFHRGADGRAVLRSSVREFLACEAMHWLGVATTRALSLVVSQTETVQRPWYSDSVTLQIPNMDDPRLEQFPPAQRKAILRSMRNQKADPNVLVSEACAITCRVAPSFVRVGHIDLMARRAIKTKDAVTTTKYDTTSIHWQEYQDLIWHACYREFHKDAYAPFFPQHDIVSAANVLLEKSMFKIATMVGNWVRVGFVQGNFNADNCLIGGYTMDYGPFGFVEEYSPVYAKWTGSGQHYGFLNQPIAGLANFNTLVVSVAPLLATLQEKDESVIVESWMTRAKTVFQRTADETFRIKMGFTKEQHTADNLWKELEPLLRGSRVDWTLFWRQLTYLMRDFPDLTSDDYDGMFSLLEAREKGSNFYNFGPFYEDFSWDLRKMWVDWIRLWREACASTGDGSITFYERMRQVNPKYVLREWALADAYKAAAKGNYAVIKALHELCQHPYDEGNAEQAKKYYRRTPEKAQFSGGTAFMS